MKVSREFKVGLVAIIAMVLLYWGFNFLKGQDVFENKKVVYAIYERVEGLTAAKPVYVNGFKVGMVDEIYFHPDGSGRLIVAFNITSDFNVPKDSKAIIQSADLLGDKAVGLILGESKENLASGDTLFADVELSLTEEVNKQVAPLKAKIEKLFGSVDTVLVLLSGFLDENAQSNFGKTFSSLKKSFESLESTLDNLDHTVATSQKDIVSTFDNLEKITGNLEKNSENLNTIFTNFNAISDSLSKVKFQETFKSLNNALVSASEVLEKVNSGDGTAGKLINDPELYDNLKKASDELDLLLLDIKYNPGRYIDLSIFGKRKDYNEEELLKKDQATKAKKAQDGK